MIYTEDILGNGFEQTTIPLRDDYEGAAVATLIRRCPDVKSTKSVLYIHGFNDYFFQADMAYEFNRHNFNFYALDLRKYGRSYLPHQKFNDIRNLKSYYEEILAALTIIRQKHNDEILLMGHSTGGLILTLFAKDYSAQGLFDGVILNSPFYDFNQSKLVKILLPAVSFLGRFFPSATISGGFTEEYGKSIHADEYGEWDYNLLWKPHIAPKVNLGWIRAIYRGQKELKTPFGISKPVLVLHSARTVSDMNDKEQIQSCDTILNVRDIDRIAHNIEGDREIVSVEGGLHDLVLSKKLVRQKVYSIVFGWIKKHRL